MSGFCSGCGAAKVPGNFCPSCRLAYNAKKTSSTPWVLILIIPFVLVAIIGILAAIAIPQFMKYQCRAKQSEAKVGMRAIASLADAYRAEQGAYPKALSALDSPPEGQRYTYEIIAADDASMKARATSTEENNGDTWLLTLREGTVQLDNQVNGCMR